MSDSQWFGYRAHLEGDPPEAFEAIVPHFRTIVAAHPNIRAPEIAWEPTTGTILVQGETFAETDSEGWEIFERVIGDLLESIDGGSGLQAIANPGADPYPARPWDEGPSPTIEGTVDGLVIAAELDGLTGVDECGLDYYLWFEQQGTAEEAARLLHGEGATADIWPDEDGDWLVEVHVRILARRQDFDWWERRIRDLASRLGGEYSGLVFHTHLGSEKAAIARIGIPSQDV